MSHRLLLDMREALSRSEAGGKGAGLGHLLQLGLDVPAFVVLTAHAYRQTCPEHQVPDTPPADIEAALDEAWARLAADGRPLAVRSSAVEEDGAERSYAGQMETFLNVTDRSALTTAVIGCWRSLQAERAVAYRTSALADTDPDTHLDPSDVAMAVVIQHQIQPDAAGVLFTVNPVNSAPDEVLVNAVHGLGEGLVAGLLNADVFVLTPDGAVKSQQLVDQGEMLISNPAGGTRTISVPADRAGQPTLDAACLKQLTRSSLRAADAAGYPLDIEFAVTDGVIHFLQARAVTGFTAREAGATTLIWDNSNINESYPGISSPLTFSFIRRAYRAVYWQFCQLLGLSRKRIEDHEAMLSNMLGLHRGQVYYHLLNWYRLVSLMPGYRFNRQFMEGMMGVSQALDRDETPLSWRQKYFIELPHLIRSGLRCIQLHRSLPRRIAQFHEAFRATHTQYANLDYSTMDPTQIMAHFHAMEKAVLWRWKAPIINDFSVMIFYGLLSKLTVSWGVDPDGALHNELVSEQGDIDSTQVAVRLQEIARHIASQDDLARRFEAAPPNEAATILKEDSEAEAALNRFLADYGDRCIEELKLESRTMTDDPALCLAMLQNQVRMIQAGFDANPQPDPDLPTATTAEIAEQVVEEKLRGRRGKFGLPLLRLYRFVLNHARAGIRNRENQRLARTRAFAVVRRMFRAIGHYYAENGRLDQADDIFYLELEELEFAADDPTLDLRSKVTERRSRYTAWHKQPPLPDRFETDGPTGPDGEPSLVHGQTDATPVTDGALTGLGAYPGLIEKPAVVLMTPDPTVRLTGEILVTRQTDPGWVLLFHGISGLIVERGSMLSHSAIVAREMRIPTIVGVANAVERINTGDVLRLDGSAGTVEILDSEGESIS